MNSNSKSKVDELPRCPGLGKGRKRKTWDFSRIKTIDQSGRRVQDSQKMKPLCKVDFVDYYVNKAPSYIRFLVQLSATDIIYVTASVMSVINADAIV